MPPAIHLVAVPARLAQASSRAPNVLPHPRRIESYIRNLLAVLEADKDGARARLAQHMPPLVLTPEASSYRITGGFDLSIWLDEQQTPGPAGDRGAAALNVRSTSWSTDR